MNSSTLRRLASDQASLRRSTPPNYLFPATQDGQSLPDDLTQLSILVTGAQGTPYSQGLWRLQLSMPDDYPKSPPKATFKTRIYHPNVEDATGAVCLDTLKKDWQSKLTLRDILITISCLLIHPNPDSALNSAAGALLQEDYDAFARQARLMTSIHAAIPQNLKAAVLEAKARGESDGARPQAEAAERPAMSRAASSGSSVIMKKQTSLTVKDAKQERDSSSTSQAVPESIPEHSDEADDGKENDPGQSPSAMTLIPESTRKNILGKRPLSELPTPFDPEFIDSDDREASFGPTASDMNILAGRTSPAARNSSLEPVKKSPKLDISARNHNANGKVRQPDTCLSPQNTMPFSIATDCDDEKENIEATRNPSSNAASAATKVAATQTAGDPPRPTLRKVSNVGSSRMKGARTGIRRL